MSVRGGKARKSKYNTHVQPYLAKIEMWCKEGITEADIAKTLGVSHNAWNDYKNQYEELRESIRNGRASLVSDVTSSLLKRALGYDVIERKTTTARLYDKDGKFIRDDVVQIQETVKHIPAEIAAIGALLRNYDKSKVTLRDDSWSNSDYDSISAKKEDMKNRKKEIELKKKKLEVEIAEEVVLGEEKS